MKTAHRGIWLQHMLTDSKNGRFVLTRVSDEVQTLLDTGSAVLILRQLRKLSLQVPEIMGGPSCWEKEWVVKW